ncbi:MAG TPA: GntR family transcriptional regulator [Candidatus Elarobacter sp.]|jgi:DNA-binding GntR family transcriptional regulator|nr:GntR family transcriptional regulator [Candidatus Elarobacter sp.]
MTAQPLRAPEPRSEGLVDALRDAILTGRYRPGTRLVQDDLAAEFGMSRIPLREALRRLEGEGLVVISPNRGAIVRPLAPKDVVDLYDVRLALESLALRRGAERYADLRASTKARHAQARSAITSRNLPALFRLDRDFHADMAAASDNPHLVAALGAQWSQIMRVMHAYFTTGEYPADTWDDHEAIADAVAHGEADVAIERLRAHLIGSRDRILGSLRAKGTPS